MYTREVDKKGRFLADFWPADEPVILNMGFGVYLHIQDRKVWVAFEDEFKRTNILDEKMADLQARMRYGQIEITLDKWSRITLPKALRDRAGIKAQIIITPQYGNYYRVWAKELYHV